MCLTRRSHGNRNELLLNDLAGVLYAPLVRALEDRLVCRRRQDVESQNGRRGKGGVKDMPPELAEDAEGRFRNPLVTLGSVRQQDDVQTEIGFRDT